MDQLFDLSRFNPGHERLLQHVGQIEASLTSGVAHFTRRRLSHLFASVALAPGQDAASFTFRDADFGSLTATAPHLLGQLIFREMRIINRYPQLYLAFE
ncbi:hypothetical protein DR950_24060 [Kitasatospora xanthocidica]|uniref:Uncharacterized protein n=1 Tax=Kitasatospora xanthocidica TaxID=83382 RepID=A0A372ZX52_9ACTN|nr:hypothetical protein [Kitasatospora xanthocidica]RGD60446.1 hypothetical protein DR950_24060 [Kitasatospora xanthocidica]